MLWFQYAIFESILFDIFICFAGVPVIPSGDWFCDPCSFGLNSKHIKCSLCPVSGGAFKSDKSSSSNQQVVVLSTPYTLAISVILILKTEPKWAHLTCATWIPETYIQAKGASPLHSIVGVSSINPERFRLRVSELPFLRRKTAQSHCLVICSAFYAGSAMSASVFSAALRAVLSPTIPCAPFARTCPWCAPTSTRAPGHSTR